MLPTFGKGPLKPDDTGMRQYRPGDKPTMRDIAPDWNDGFPGWIGGDNRGGNGGGNGGGGGMLSAFFPGQKNALASQLAAGFGGGMDKWRGILSQSYSNMPMPMPFEPGSYNKNGMKVGDGRGKGDGRDKDPRQPDTTDNDAYPFSRNFGFDFPGSMEAGMNAAPRQIQNNAAGRIAGPAQAQMAQGQQQQQLNPQILAMLRQRLMGG